MQYIIVCAIRKLFFVNVRGKLHRDTYVDPLGPYMLQSGTMQRAVAESTRPMCPFNYGHDKIKKILILIILSQIKAGKITREHGLTAMKEQSRLGAKTINVFRACLGAQLTICAQK